MPKIMLSSQASRLFCGSYAVVAASLLLVLRTTPAAEPEAVQMPVLVMPEPISDDDSGFATLFDGKTLQGWEGDPTYWRVENNSIIGETTRQTAPKENNSFLIWRGGRPADFELKLQYRITREGNSGINYRSEELSLPRWAMRGYQYDIDGPDWGKSALSANLKVPAALTALLHFRVTGQNYEERGRQFLALPGQFTSIAPGKTQHIVGYVGNGEQVDEIATDGWNDVHIIARGPLLIHILNRRVTSVVIDDDAKNRQLEGKLGVQIHVGPPMKVEFRNIRLKKL